MRYLETSSQGTSGRERERMRWERPLPLIAHALICGLAIVGLSGDSAAREHPHVLFLAVDDLKDWVGCLGGYGGVVHTPNIDRLADRGVLFTNAHCPSPKCAPSRAAILTGLRPSTTGLYENSHWWFPNLPEEVTLPMRFREEGYHVVGTGKIFHHTAGNNPPRQWDAFDRLLFRDDPWFRSVKINYPWSETGPYPEGFPFSGVAKLGHENDWGSLEISEGDYDDSRTAGYAVRFLEEADGAPFFLACGFFRPHLPWYVPNRWFDLYPVEEVVLPAVRSDDLDDVPDAGRSLAADRRSDLDRIREAGKWKEAVQAYLASISYADAQLGRVLDALDRREDAAETIVVLWSDHGWHLGEKDHWHKSTLWEEATRIPFIIAGPGISPSRCAAPVSLVDLYPTLLDLCGFEPKEGLDGTSLVPLLEDPERSWDRPAVIEYRRGNAAVRSHQHRLIRYEDGSEELYDLVNDPEEWNNLASDPDFKSIKSKLARWIPDSWANSAPTKKAFAFDPETYSWEHLESGKVIHGSEP